MAFQFNNTLSLYIPSVLAELATNEGIRHYLQRFGHIKAVDILQGSNDGVYKAFVHFNEWYDDEFSQKYQRDIMDPNVRVDLDIGNGFFILLPKWKKKHTQNFGAHSYIHKLGAEINRLDALPTMPEYLQPLMYPYLSNSPQLPPPSRLVRTHTRNRGASSSSDSSDFANFGTTYDAFSNLIDMYDEMTEVNDDIWPSLPNTPPPTANTLMNQNTPRGVNNLPAWMTQAVNPDMVQATFPEALDEEKMSKTRSSN